MGWIVCVVFQVKFTDSKRPRSVTVRPRNNTHHTRDDDEQPVKQWLRRQESSSQATIREGWAAHATLAAFKARPGPDPEARNAAEDWLRDLLKHGPLPTEQVKSEAASAGIAWRTIRRAAETLGVHRRRQGFGPGGTWAWQLPKEAP